jgi:hypothetical protein
MLGARVKISETTETIEVPKNAKFARITHSDITKYNNALILYTSYTKKYDIAELMVDVEVPEYVDADGEIHYKDADYGYGISGVCYNKVDLENGVYIEYMNDDFEIYDEPIVVDIKDKIVKIFGQEEPVVKVTSRGFTFENDNDDQPVPSTVTYNIIQEAKT